MPVKHIESTDNLHIEPAFAREYMYGKEYKKSRPLPLLEESSLCLTGIQSPCSGQK